MNRHSKLFLKDGEYSKPSIVLVVFWMVILIWYLLTGFGFLKDWPLEDYFAVPVLAAVSAYYFGRYNFVSFRNKVMTDFNQYKKQRQQS